MNLKKSAVRRVHVVITFEDGDEIGMTLDRPDDGAMDIEMSDVRSVDVDVLSPDPHAPGTAEVTMRVVRRWL